MSGILLNEEKKMVEELKNDQICEFRVGDTIKVSYKIQDEDKTRTHTIQGIVLKMANSQHRKSFTIKRLSSGVSMEITMPLFSPKVEKIELVSNPKRTPRRAKLYYIRKRNGKAAMEV